MCSPVSEPESVGSTEDSKVGGHIGEKAKEQTMPGNDSARSRKVPPEEKEKIDSWVTHLAESKENHHKDAMWGLRSLTRRSSVNRDYIAGQGAIPVVVSVLKDSRDAETKKHAVTLLFNLSITAHLKDAIVAAGAVEPIVEVLKNGDDEARQNAAAALFSLSAKGTNSASIGNTDAIPALVKLLIDGTPKGKKDAASAIFDLSILKENKAKAVEAGVIPPLVHLLTDKSQGLINEALATLALLATHQESQAEIGRVNALPILVDFVVESNPQNRENAACILLELCSNDPNHVYTSAKLGLCGPLGELSSTGTARARRKAKKLLDLFRHSQHLVGPPGSRSI